MYTLCVFMDNFYLYIYIYIFVYIYIFIFNIFIYIFIYNTPVYHKCIYRYVHVVYIMYYIHK